MSKRKFDILTKKGLAKDFSEDIEAINGNLSLYQKTDEKNTPGGYAGLDDSGKLVETVLPALAITQVYLAVNQTEHDQIKAQTGDIVIRADLNKSFIYTGSTWTELLNPPAPVTSVEGKTGAVTLQDIYAPIDHFHEKINTKKDKILISELPVLHVVKTSFLETDFQEFDYFTDIVIFAYWLKDASITNVVVSITDSTGTEIYNNNVELARVDCCTIVNDYKTDAFFAQLKLNRVFSGNLKIKISWGQQIQTDLFPCEGCKVFHEDTYTANPLQNYSLALLFYNNFYAEVNTKNGLLTLISPEGQIEDAVKAILQNTQEIVNTSNNLAVVENDITLLNGRLTTIENPHNSLLSVTYATTVTSHSGTVYRIANTDLIVLNIKMSISAAAGDEIFRITGSFDIPDIETDNLLITTQYGDIVATAKNSISGTEILNISIPIL